MSVATRSYEDFSFIEALTLKDPVPLLSQGQLRLFPVPPNTTKTSTLPSSNTTKTSTIPSPNTTRTSTLPSPPNTTKTSTLPSPPNTTKTSTLPSVPRPLNTTKTSTLPSVPRPQNSAPSSAPLPSPPSVPDQKVVPVKTTTVIDIATKPAKSTPLAPVDDIASKSAKIDQPLPNMTSISSKAQAQCLEHCHKTTTLGDRLSIRFLEYLTTAKQLPHGFEILTHDFLDTCQILFSLEAGLRECIQNSQNLPTEMITELVSKYRVTQANFRVLDQMLAKFLEYESGTMGRMKRGFGKIFGDSDIQKMISALSKTRESLRMSALVFQWTLGSEKIEREMGIGFTGLAAALNRMDQKSGSVTAQSLNGIGSPHPIQSIATPKLADDRSSIQQYQLPPVPPVPWSENSVSIQREPSIVKSTSSRDGKAFVSPETGNVSETTVRSVPLFGPIDGRESRTTHLFDHISAVEESYSQASTVENDSLLDEVDGVALGTSKAVRFKVEPFNMPRWAPRNTAGLDMGNMKATLFSAVRSKNHKLMEQLLDRGVSPNTGPNTHALKEAISCHDDESVRLLLLFGADPNDPDREGINPLVMSVKKSSLAAATLLLKYGADPNLVTDPDQESALATTVVANMISFTHLLLVYNGDVNQISSNGEPLLIRAINKKTPTKFIDLLLEYGANPNLKSNEGKSALFEAIQTNRADIVTTLLDHGADPNLPGPKHMLWPSTYHSSCLEVLLSHGADFKKCPGIMELACSINNVESVRILLKAGVNPNLKKDGVYTPLCTSIRDNRADLVQLLLENGADPNCMASEYPTFKCITHDRIHFLPALVAAGADLNSPKGILEEAVNFNNIKALNWLLDQGVNPNVKGSKGTPLTTAIRENRMDMIDLLLRRGADPNVRGQDWPVCMAVRNPPILKRILSVLTEPQAFKGVMEMAVHADQLESVKLLLAAGVSVEDKNGGVFSPLTTALRENHREIVRYLLTEGGADVNAPGEHLPIVKALRRFHGEDTEMLELLLQHGADPNKVYRGWNAMMQAVENGDEDVLRLLTQKSGVNLDVRDEMGRTVVEIAASRGWDEAVGILLGGSVRQ